MTSPAPVSSASQDAGSWRAWGPARAGAVHVDLLAQVDRPLLERYLAHLHAELAGRAVHRHMIGQLNLFFIRGAQTSPGGHTGPVKSAVAAVVAVSWPRPGKEGR